MFSAFINISHYVAAVGAIEWGLHAFLGCGLVGFVSSVIGVKHIDTAIYAFVAVCGVVSLLSQLGVIGGM